MQDEDQIENDQLVTELERHLRCVAVLYATAASPGVGGVGASSHQQLRYRPVSETALFNIWRAIWDHQEPLERRFPDMEKKAAKELLPLAISEVEKARNASASDVVMPVAPRGLTAEWRPPSSRTAHCIRAAYLASVGVELRAGFGDPALRVQLLLVRASALFMDPRPLDETHHDLALTSAVLACAELLQSGFSNGANNNSSSSSFMSVISAFSLAVELAIARKAETHDVVVKTTMPTSGSRQQQQQQQQQQQPSALAARDTVGGAIALSGAAPMTAGYVDIAKMIFEAGLVFLSRNNRMQNLSDEADLALRRFKALAQLWAPTPPRSRPWADLLLSSSPPTPGHARWIVHSVPASSLPGEFVAAAGKEKQQKNNHETENEEKPFVWKVPPPRSSTSSSSSSSDRNPNVIHCVRVESNDAGHLVFTDVLLSFDEDTRNQEPCFSCCAAPAVAARAIIVSPTVVEYTVGLLEGPVTIGRTHRRDNPFPAVVGASAFAASGDSSISASIGSVIFFRADGQPVVANEAKAIFEFLSQAAGGGGANDVALRQTALASWQKRTDVVGRLNVSLIS